MSVKIHVLGSSSKGNGYVIDVNGEHLIIECGCRVTDAMAVCKYKLNTISGCIVTHRHDDHARYVSEYSVIGVKVLAPPDVVQFKNLSENRNVTAIEVGKAYALGNFILQPLKAYHDVECVSWIIYNKLMGRVVFATDTKSFPYRIPNVTFWMIEANYSDYIVEMRYDQGLITTEQKRRLYLTHLEIDNTIKALQRNYPTRDNRRQFVDVMLIHLSDSNSDARTFRQRVRREARMNAVVAEPGMIVEF